MMAHTHIAFGLSATILLAIPAGVVPHALSWLFIILGCLAPDIDHGSSLIAKPGSLFGTIIPRGFSKFVDRIGLVISSLVNKLFGHRGVLHWPIVGAILCTTGLFLDWIWLIWFGWGYLWHILGDFCTKGGVPLFGPMIRRNIRWSPLRTGSWQETILSFFLWGIVWWWTWQQLPRETQEVIYRGMTRVIQQFR